MNTQHSLTRMRQRGVPSAVMNWLLNYGSKIHDHRGAQVIIFDKAARNRLACALGKQVVGRLGHLLDAYAVVSVNDGAVVTVGYRTRRVFRT